MGTRRKRLSMFQDETENTERRRSSRIIALEEKKQEERGRRKMVSALPADNNFANRNNRNKEKGKAKIDVDDHLDDSSEDKEHGPTKKGRKSKALQQLISSTKEGQHPQSAGTSRTNVSSMNNIPEKSILEFILDNLQRLDTEELFAEPVNPDVVKGYYRIVKQPMDFGTMRAKLHEDMYTNLEQFKRDVYLICSNAMNANPANSRHHKVAEVINSQARKVLEGVSADPEHFDVTFSITKGLPNRNLQVRKPRSSRTPRAPPKPAGKDKATQSRVPGTKRRDMYWPPTNKSLVSEFINVNKFDIQLNQDASNYRDSLLQFVDGLGPTPQRVAAKKLEALNLLENVPGTQIIPHPTPQEPTQPKTSLNNADRLSLALATPGTSAQENRNSNTTAGGVNINDGSHQGNNTCVDESWNAKAAAILGNIFISSDRGKKHSGFESSNARGTMDIWGLSKGKMVSPHENVLSLPGPVQEGLSHKHELQLGANPKGKTVQWNTSAGIHDRSATESSRRVLTHVWPTKVIQPKPLESQCGKSHSGLSFIPKSRAEDSMPNANHRDISLVPHQPRPTNSKSIINNSGLSLASQPRPRNSINIRGLSLVPKPRPEHSMSGINHSSSSLMPQLKPGESSIPSNNSSGQFSQAAQFSNWNQQDTSLSGLGTPYQPGDFQPMMGPSSTNFNNTSHPLQKNYEQVVLRPHSNNTPYPLKKIYEPVVLQQPAHLNNTSYPIQKSRETVLQQSASNTPPASSSDLQMKPASQQNPLQRFRRNEPETALDLGMPTGSAVNYYGGGAALADQTEEDIQHLLWDNDQQANLSLQL